MKKKYILILFLSLAVSGNGIIRYPGSSLNTTYQVFSVSFRKKKHNNKYKINLLEFLAVLIIHCVL